MKTQQKILNYIETDLDYRTAIPDLVKKMKAAASSVDLRDIHGRDLCRCLLHNGAEKLDLLFRQIDTRPWNTWPQRLTDAYAVFRGRALAIYVTQTVFDDWKKPNHE
jgi:hypothetical protein